MNENSINTLLSTEEFRCLSCKKLLAVCTNNKKLEIKCHRCDVLNTTYKNTNDHVIITDSQGKILFINQAVETATGFSVLESIGQKISSLWGGYMSQQFYENLWAELSQHKRAIKTTMTNRTKDGNNYKVEFVVSPILDENKEFLFFIGIGTMIE